MDFQKKPKHNSSHRRVGVDGVITPRYLDHGRNVFLLSRFKRSNVVTHHLFVLKKKHSKKNFPKNILFDTLGKTSNVFICSSLISLKRKWKKFFSTHAVLKRSLSATLVFIVVFAAFFQNIQKSQGATYTWSQLNWSGGQTNNNAVHPGNQNGWTQYQDKDSSVNIVNGSEDAKIAWTVGSTVYASDNGNEAISDSYATLAPKKKENIIQIIINNFQAIFHWVKV